MLRDKHTSIDEFHSQFKRLNLVKKVNYSGLKKPNNNYNVKPYHKLKKNKIIPSPNLTDKNVEIA